MAGQVYISICAFAPSWHVLTGVTWIKVSRLFFKGPRTQGDGRDHIRLVWCLVSDGNTPVERFVHHSAVVHVSGNRQHRLAGGRGVDGSRVSGVHAWRWVSVVAVHVVRVSDLKRDRLMRTVWDGDVSRVRQRLMGQRWTILRDGEAGFEVGWTSDVRLTELCEAVADLLVTVLSHVG
jgi:hypothetical protein